jgi:hypothetical protein
MPTRRILLGAALFAAALAAQNQRSVAGTVTEFKALEIGVKADNGEAAFLQFGADTQVVAVTPGERDLSQARPAAVTDIVVGDRIMATFVAGLTPARRIVLITGRDIAKRNEAERQDWKLRGISGIVSSVAGDQILLEIRTPEGAHTVTVTAGPKTRIRRYAPDTVRFNDALPAATTDISKGDQLQARGPKSEGDTKMLAEDVVFGTFLTKLGTITAVNLESREIRIQEAIGKQPLTVHFTSASQLKMMPDMRAMIFGAKPGGGNHTPLPPSEQTNGKFDLQRTLEQLPAGKLDDLKVGGGVIVTSTNGAKGDEITAIMMLANADFFVMMAQGSAKDASGASGMDAIGKLHGGMLGGPGGISLPTMIQ